VFVRGDQVVKARIWHHIVDKEGYFKESTARDPSMTANMKASLQNTDLTLIRVPKNDDGSFIWKRTIWGELYLALDVSVDEVIK
jgi:hypothetical protein